MTIAPLDLPGVMDACYSFEITNGEGERVVARGRSVDGTGTGVAGQGGDGGPSPALPAGSAIEDPLCSTRFGNSQGAISYVAPCDASTTPAGNEIHTVRLWVNSVCEGGSGFGDDCVPLNGFVNPCGPGGCAVTAACVENADVPVSFNFTIMASAQQGFFDVAVNFDNVFCSAKLDTCYEDGTPIELLHDTHGVRQRTAVAAVACTAGAGEIETVLHFTALEVTCGEGPAIAHTLDLSQVAREGNLGTPNPSLGTLTGAIYFGTELLEDVNKVYTNVVFIVPAGESCSVDWTIVPSSSLESPQPSDGSAGVLSQVAGVVFDPTHAIVSPGTCANYSLNGQGPGADLGVVTSYLDGSDADGAGIAYVAGLAFGTVWFEATGLPSGPHLPDSPEGFSFVYVPEGIYTRGSPVGEVGRSTNESQHVVSLTRPFMLQATEVTQGQWKSVSGGVNPSTYSSCGDACPVETVNWFSALGFANALTALDPSLTSCYTLTGCQGAWQNGGMTCSGVVFADEDCTGYRLPTEAEWEFAARAGTTAATYGGNLSASSGCVSLSGAPPIASGTLLGALAWYDCNNNPPGPKEVGILLPNQLGLFDMLGNVWEWTWDVFGVYPSGSLESPAVDPVGPAAGAHRVYRGGRFGHDASRARSAHRGGHSFSPSSGNGNLGLRLARTLPP